MRQGAILTLLGVAAGSGGGGCSPGAVGMLYQVAPLDPLDIPPPPAAVLIAIAAGVLSAARRATRRRPQGAAARVTQFERESGGVDVAGLSPSSLPARPLPAPSLQASEAITPRWSGNASAVAISILWCAPPLYYHVSGLPRPQAVD